MGGFVRKSERAARSGSDNGRYVDPRPRMTEWTSGHEWLNAWLTHLNEPPGAPGHETTLGEYHEPAEGAKKVTGTGERKNLIAGLHTGVPTLAYVTAGYF